MPLRVLVVDDEPPIREMMVFAFQRQNALAVPAESAEEAIAKLDAERFDAALVDKNLPGMNGIELIRRIRATGSDMALLVMTGFSGAETAAEALNLDVDAYLEKPFSRLTDVVERVRSAVAARAAWREALAAPLEQRGTRVVVLAPADVREQLAALADAETVISGADSETRFIHALRESADVVVIDGQLFGERVPDLVQRTVELSPSAEIVVLASAQLSLPSLQRLIDLGVRRLVQRTHLRPVFDIVEKIRRRLDGN